MRRNIQCDNIDILGKILYIQLDQCCQLVIDSPPNEHKITGQRDYTTSLRHLFTAV
jgi:hypothetical protein